MNDSGKIYQKTLKDIEAEGLYKQERVSTTPQRVQISTDKGNEVLNFCANNYLFQTIVFFTITTFQNF